MKKPWDSTTDEFLDLPRHILEFVTTEEHNKHKISVVGRSGCGLQCFRTAALSMLTLNMESRNPMGRVNAENHSKT